MRWGLRLVLGAVLVLLAYLNLRLYYQPTLVSLAGQPVNHDLVRHLQFLRTGMHEGAAAQMQELYPEGFVYQNVLYALTWTELLPHLPVRSSLRAQAKAEANWAIRQIQSPVGRLTLRRLYHDPGVAQQHRGVWGALAQRRGQTALIWAVAHCRHLCYLEQFGGSAPIS